MDEIARYIFEAGMLKRVKRSGWWTEGIDNPESVAEHSFRTSLIAFILARMEGFPEASAHRICTAALFHDMHETRILDLNHMATRYVRVDEVLHRKVEKDQVRKIEPALKDAILGALRLPDKEMDIVDDADKLELVFQAKEYSEYGYKGTARWTEGKAFKSGSAKKLYAAMKDIEPGSWRDG